MKPAAERLAKRLADTPIRRPAIPVVQNVTAAVANDPESIRDSLARQLYSPVRWVESIRHAADGGTSHILEFGPGKVLGGLARRIDDRLTGLSVNDPASLDGALDTVKELT
jgi:[acyl-carrier-protein] S-malonyltransferase